MGQQTIETTKNESPKQADDQETAAILPAESDVGNPTIATPYKSRKPLWWKKLGHGKPTKGQKKAMQAMQSTHQLPRLGYNEFYDWPTIFGATAAAYPRWLEVGCGSGENLLGLAQRNPKLCLLGAEMHASGIGNMFQRIHQATQRNFYWQDYTPYSVELEEAEAQQQTVEHGASKQPEENHVNYNDESLYGGTPPSDQGPYPNVRIFAGNGLKVLQASPDGSLSTVLITFPDPFPKQPEYRLLQKDVIQEIYRALQPKRGILVVATDHDGHAAWAQAQIEQQLAWQRVKCTPEI